MSKLRTVRSIAVGGIAGICTFLGIKNGVNRWRVIAKTGEPVALSVSSAGANGGDLGSSGSGRHLKLVNVQVFFRHGARTPLNFIEAENFEKPTYDKAFHARTLPHTEVPYEVFDIKTGGQQPRSRMDERQSAIILKGGTATGQLTTLGRDQMYMLGKRLRNRYVEELNFISHFDVNDIYIRSTNVRRTIKSLECVLAGLFGADHFKNKDPVKIPVMHSFYETLYPNFRNCSTLERIHSTYHSRLLADSEYTAIMGTVQKGLGNNPDEFLEMMRIRDDVVARKAHGLFIPKWLQNIDSDIERGAVISLKNFVGGDDAHHMVAVSLTAGPLYHLIEKNMKSAFTGKKSTQKFHMYSCHDTSVYPLLLVLGKHLDAWPPYSADVRFELYEDQDKGHWVKAFFCGKEVIPQGFETSLLSFEEFQKLIRPYVVTPEQYEHRCSDIKVAKEFAKFWETAKPDTAPDEATVPPIM